MKSLHRAIYLLPTGNIVLDPIDKRGIRDSSRIRAYIPTTILDQLKSSLEKCDSHNRLFCHRRRESKYQFKIGVVLSPGVGHKLIRAGGNTLDAACHHHDISNFVTPFLQVRIITSFDEGQRYTNTCEPLTTTVSLQVQCYL